ncbi:histidine kinase N-terminal 7TM domain-containing protein [Frigidibacter mobilis]|uniref:histidine kinase n=1 Tax=Frigidibacter mobilis TaxID=1335048 RepID=A0A159Z2S3_9RHOB|nr:histidine kinase N-terminal 7TM domain-containing protein [Frigidibacter mobilis]AMY69346.1 periplasmic sensor hybrid histidine kinase [Frigidibacter mobilis]
MFCDTGSGAVTGCLHPQSLDLAVGITAAVLAGVLLVMLRVWQIHRFPGRPYFVLAHCAMLWWLLSSMMELSVQGLPCKMLWAKLAWPGIVLVPTAWTLFLLDYALGRHPLWWRLRSLALIGAPLAVTLLALSNGWHTAFYGPGTRLAEIDGRSSVIYDHGPLFYLSAYYVYGFMLASIAIVGLAILRAPWSFRGFLLTLLAITLVPVVGNLAYVLSGFTLFGFDPTPFSFALVLVVFGWMLANNRLMDINLIARDMLFYKAADPVLIVDAEGRLEAVNPEARRVFGAALPRPGEPLSALPDLAPLLARLQSGGHLHDEPPILRGGRSFDPRAGVLHRPVRTGRSALGWVISLVDITAQQQEAAALRLAAENARAAELAKSQFLSVVSHELRTPLTSIKGALDLLNNEVTGELPERARRIVQIAASNSARLTTLIEDLLDLQQIEQGTLSVERRRLDMGALVQEAVVVAADQARSLGVTLVLAEAAGPAMVEGDPKRLAQVIGNVLSNACKFSGRGARVEVSVLCEPGRMRVRVKDSGPGIPAGADEAVFGQFSQLDSSGTRRVGGSGVGLHIARRILDEMGGQISYESRLGEGTTFFIDLPLAPEPAVVLA